MLGWADRKGLTALRKLSLGGVEISDAGLWIPKGLARLKDVDLFHSRVTDAGVKEVQIARPRLRIRR